MDFQRASMNKVLCFVSDEMADFEITLVIHGLKTQGNREIITVGYDLAPVVSQSELTYLPNRTLAQALDIPGVEALIIPGGPIRNQRNELTELIRKIDNEKKLLAAICYGPQYLGRAGILDNHRYTTSCSEEKIRSLQVPDPFPRDNYLERRVVRDGHVITAKGRAFVDYSFAIFAYLDIYSGKRGEKESLYNEIMDR
jgi:putative intracellular protease/amidase